MLQPACPTAPWCFDRFAVQISSVQEKQITVEGYNRCDGKEEHTLDPLVFERCVEWGFCWVEWGFLLESTSHHTTQPLVEFGAQPRAVNLCCSMRQQEGPTQPSPGQWLVKWKRQQPTSPKVIWRRETIIQRAKEAFAGTRQVLTSDICGKRLMAKGRARPKAARHTRLCTGRIIRGRDLKRDVLERKSSVRPFHGPDPHNWCRFPLMGRPSWGEDLHP